ncbi:MAG TPA: tRNA (guanosine(46)-N7)-methyltransferase TrmB [Opitutus sp.]|nr:tRNA (guanosine(46)-N7)-methyltransferase TrmB [Opitutus sp.]
MAEMPGKSALSSPTEKHVRHLARLLDRRTQLAPLVASAIGGAQTFVLEIGCGHGHFLTAYANVHRDELCIGVDIASDRIARAVRKQERAGLANLHFIRADADLLLDALPSSVAISAVFILFPDPWPKLRHHKHRIAQAWFLGRLAERLGEDGRLYFRTDHLPYFESTRTEISMHPRLVLVEEGWPFECPTVFQNRAVRYYSLTAKLRPPEA